MKSGMLCCCCVDIRTRLSYDTETTRHITLLLSSSTSSLGPLALGVKTQTPIGEHSWLSISPLSSNKSVWIFFSILITQHSRMHLFTHRRHNRIIIRQRALTAVWVSSPVSQWRMNYRSICYLFNMKLPTDYDDRFKQERWVHHHLESNTDNVPKMPKSDIFFTIYKNPFITSNDNNMYSMSANKQI